MRIVHVMKRFFNTTAAVLALSALACGSDEDGTGPEITGATIRVLFIGNSLTYTNDLPRMVVAVANTAGRNIVAESMSYPNYALIDHWNDGVVQETIRSGDFDYVVLQQGPSSVPINRDSLRIASLLFEPVIRESGATPALFAVWPDISRFDFFPDVAESYRLAAQDVNGLYLPVGNTWLAAWNERPTAPFYGPDGYHPGPAGSYAAAVVMVAAFTGLNPETFSTEAPGVGVEASLRNVIHTAARVTLSSTTLLPR
jgi:hypothetical protein